MPLLSTLWDHTHGNTLSLCNMMQMRAEKSVWTVGAGDILTIPDDTTVDRNLFTEYGRLTIGNIDTAFSIYKAKSGRQMQKSAQLDECLLTSICPKTAEIILAEQNLWKAQNMQCVEKLFKLLMNDDPRRILDR